MQKTQVPTTAIEDAVHLADRAPSYHNSQPWKWLWDGHVLDLFLDSDRLVHTDHSRREALISCGAVLDHLRVAMAAAGWTAQVDRFPNPNNLHHLASVDFKPLAFVTDAHRLRADAILRRRSDRLPFSAPRDWERFVTMLRHEIDREVAAVDVLGDDAGPGLAEASQLTDALRLYDSAYHAELDWWTASFGTSDGIPHSALVSAAESDRVGIGRTFPVTHHRERRLDIPEDRAKVIVISALNDSHDDILGCGEVLSAVLLEATMAGLATCTLTHMTEVTASSDIIRGLTGRSLPQVLVRVGMASALDEVPPPTPRRPLMDVLEIRPRH